jgi:hypothetical protein
MVIMFVCICVDLPLCLLSFELKYFFHQSDMIIAGNAGVCTIFPQFFGMGAETQKTAARVPDPYGIEVGNSLKVPAGYLEKWKFNIHVT